MSICDCQYAIGDLKVKIPTQRKPRWVGHPGHFRQGAPAGGFDGRFEVFEDLFGLDLEIAGADEIAGRIQSNLSRDEDQLAADDLSQMRITNRFVHCVGRS